MPDSDQQMPADVMRRLDKHDSDLDRLTQTASETSLGLRELTRNVSEDRIDRKKENELLREDIRLAGELNSRTIAELSKTLGEARVDQASTRAVAGKLDGTQLIRLAALMTTLSVVVGAMVVYVMSERVGPLEQRMTKAESGMDADNARERTDAREFAELALTSTSHTNDIAIIEKRTYEHDRDVSGTNARQDAQIAELFRNTGIDDINVPK